MTYGMKDPDVVLARRILEALRERDALLGSSFGEPAWEILLELFAIQGGEEAVCVSALCKDVCAPSRVALRWVTTLEDEGKLILEAASSSSPRVRLSPATAATMRTLLSRWRQTSLAPVARAHG